MPDMSKPALDGLKAAGRELAVRFMRRVYEHVAVWRLGYTRAEPFLRDAVLWVAHVLHPMHLAAPTSKRIFKFGFAMLHGNALHYAAECTVATTLHVRHELQASKGQPGNKRAAKVARACTYQVGSCCVAYQPSPLGAPAAIPFCMCF